MILTSGVGFYSFRVLFNFHSLYLKKLTRSFNRNVVNLVLWAGTSPTSSTGRTSTPLRSSSWTTWTTWTPNAASPGRLSASCWARWDKRAKTIWNPIFSLIVFLTESRFYTDVYRILDVKRNVARQISNFECTSYGSYLFCPGPIWRKSDGWLWQAAVEHLHLCLVLGQYLQPRLQVLRGLPPPRVPGHRGVRFFS